MLSGEFRDFFAVEIPPIPLTPPLCFLLRLPLRTTRADLDAARREGDEVLQHTARAEQRGPQLREAACGAVRQGNEGNAGMML